MNFPYNILCVSSKYLNSIQENMVNELLATEIPKKNCFLYVMLSVMLSWYKFNSNAEWWSEMNFGMIFNDHVNLSKYMISDDHFVVIFA